MSNHPSKLLITMMLLRGCGVFSELVSGSNSLLTGKNAGNFHEFSLKFWPVEFYMLLNKGYMFNVRRNLRGVSNRELSPAHQGTAFPRYRPSGLSVTGTPHFGCFNTSTICSLRIAATSSAIPTALFRLSNEDRASLAAECLSWSPGQAGC